MEQTSDLEEQAGAQQEKSLSSSPTTGSASTCLLPDGSPALSHQTSVMPHQPSSTCADNPASEKPVKLINNKKEFAVFACIGLLYFVSFCAMAMIAPFFALEGVLELFTGLGLMAGPVIGGGLYQLGGFRLPFITVGSVVWFNLIVIYLLLPGNEAYQGSDPADREPGSLWKVLSVPGVIAIGFVVTSGGLLMSFLDPTLPSYLEKITHNGLNKAQIGLVFLILPTFYTLAAPMFGTIADKKVPARYLILGGHVVVAASYFFIGPSPLVISFIPSRLWLTGVSLAVLGLGLAPVVLPCLLDMQSVAEKAGIPLTVGTNSILSGIFTATFSVGGALGPALGGTLVEHMSFNWAATIFAFVMAFEGFCLLLFTIWERNFYLKRYAPLATTVEGVHSEKIEPHA